ncbi:NEP1-interacting protein-like 1 [Morus notabilis]|uniref:NEP1-interacting protein-like 1 n=1 Tax=Morus notabilis TaxID=981085 RepID=W9QQ37_9ROSA|nr:NEP1-interacting protein-like 1 [Morus notabilis]EXB50310.1 NEP1-interacting protein-like 1 [Morus notabilis]
MASSSVFSFMKGWFPGQEVLSICASFSKSFVRLMKKIVFAAFTCFFALGGAIVGAIHGAIKGQTTETGFLKGAIIGGLAGAVAAIQLLDSAIDGEPFSKAAILRSLVNGKVFMDYASPAMLKAYQWQISPLETTYRDISDIYDTAANKGLSQICIQNLPSHKYHPSKNHQHDFCCSICLQEVKREESVRRLPNCGHFFHLDCIDQWLMRQGSCPICRIHVYDDKN